MNSNNDPSIEEVLQEKDSEKQKQKYQEFALKENFPVFCRECHSILLLRHTETAAEAFEMISLNKKLHSVCILNIRRNGFMR